MSFTTINLWYIVSAALFIFGLKQLGSPATAVRGNLLSSIAMLLAVVVTPLARDIVAYHWIMVGIIAGAIVGAFAATKIEMTEMPEMVALLNGSGGIASLLVGWAALYTADVNSFIAFTIFLSVLIGGITFTGSLVAYGKLSEKITSAAIVFDSQRIVNGALLALTVLCGVFFCVDPSPGSFLFYLAIILALVLGVMVVIPIGGADMPVVISLLNSYSGLAACAAGFAINNNILIVAGALVGAAGIILTNIMCRAMNRNFVSVIMGGFGTTAGDVDLVAAGVDRTEGAESGPEFLQLSELGGVQTLASAAVSSFSLVVMIPHWTRTIISHHRILAVVVVIAIGVCCWW